MQRLVYAQLLDVIPFKQGFVYSKKDLLSDGNVKVSFLFFNVESNKEVQISKNDYLHVKFGNAYRNIVEQLGDFINCDTSFFSNGAVAVAYKAGDFYIFDSDGSLVDNHELLYQDSPVQSPAVDEKCIWFVVPERNAVISYSPNEQRVLLRIGGGKSNAFDYPAGVTKILDKLYICNRNSYKIRSIKLEDYSVKDCFTFDEPVYKYFQIYNKQITVLESGVYSL